MQVANFLIRFHIIFYDFDVTNDLVDEIIGIHD